jgi:outer membrane protein
MKNTNYIISGILAVAIIILYILQFSQNRGETKSGSDASGPDSVSFRLPIAYIRTDSLLNNYRFSNDLNDAMLKKMEDQQLIINQRSQKFQQEVVDYQQKAQLNAFYSQERRQQEETRLTRQQEDLEKFTNQTRQNLALEQMKIQQQLQDTILSALKLFNTPQKYQVIFSNINYDNLFYADDAYDITQEVIEFLNIRYTPTKDK